MCVCGGDLRGGSERVLSFERHFARFGTLELRTRSSRDKAMTRSNCFKVGIGFAIAALAGIQPAPAQVPTFSAEPARVPPLGTIDERFQSYNLEMIEATWGNFWKPYRSSASASDTTGAGRWNA